MRISDQSLFIPDLGKDFRPDALNSRNDTGNVTTMAVGEEGGGEVTTMAVGEEGGGDVTTMALGEEGCAGPELGSGPTQLEKLLDLFVCDLGR